MRKVVTAFPEEPLYVLGVIGNYRWYQFRSANSDRKLVDEISAEIRFPGQTVIVPLEETFKYLRKAFEPIAGARIVGR